MSLTTTSSAGDLLPTAVPTIGVPGASALGTAAGKSTIPIPGTFAGLIADAQILAVNNEQPKALLLQPEEAQADENLQPTATCNAADIGTVSTAGHPVASQLEPSAAATAEQTWKTEQPEASASAAEIAEILVASTGQYRSATGRVQQSPHTLPINASTSPTREGIEAENAAGPQQTQTTPEIDDTHNVPAIARLQLPTKIDLAAPTQPVVQSSQRDTDTSGSAQCAEPDVVSTPIVSAKPLLLVTNSAKITHTRTNAIKDEVEKTDLGVILHQAGEASSVPQPNVATPQGSLAQAISLQPTFSESRQSNSISTALPRMVQPNMALFQKIGNPYGANGSEVFEVSGTAPVDTDAVVPEEASQQTDVQVMEALSADIASATPVTHSAQPSEAIAFHGTSSQQPASRTTSVAAIKSQAKQTVVEATNSVSRPSTATTLNKARAILSDTRVEDKTNATVSVKPPAIISGSAIPVAAVNAPMTGNVREGAVQPSALNAVATAISSMNQSALQVAEPQNQQTSLAIGLNDAQLGPVQIHAALANTGEVHIGIAGDREQARAVIEQIAPLMHAAVTQQADAQGSTMSFRVAASSAGSALAGDTSGQTVHHQSSTWQGNMSSNGGLAQQTPQREPKQGAAQSGPSRNRPVAEAEENYASLPRSSATPLFTAVTTSRSYGNLSVRI